MKKNKVLTLPLLPLRDMVVFPFTTVPLFVGRKGSVSAVSEALRNNSEIILTAQKSAGDTTPLPEDLFETGVVAKIEQFTKKADGSIKIVVHGLTRVKIKKISIVDDFFSAKIESLAYCQESTTESFLLMDSVKDVFRHSSALTGKFPEDMLERVFKIQDPGLFADTASYMLSLDTLDKQRLLELTDPADRLIELHDILDTEIGRHGIDDPDADIIDMNAGLERDAFSFQDHLNGLKNNPSFENEADSELAELEARINSAKLPDNVNERALRELKRLEQMPPLSSEGSVIRNYIDCLIETPWDKRSKENPDISHAWTVLDSEHYALTKIKERIIEFLSVKALTKITKGPILCFTGPPGVGKTSLGKSIALATGRKFTRFSLGGIRDEAEIRGHRRTYVGAMPGKIVHQIKKTGTKNPVFMLDEIDKISSDYRGDPASALLEVLDPEQNQNFNDHFLDLDFDLSEVMFIATANVTHTIPKPLLDRMEVISMGGYTEDEKTAIADRYLIKKNITSHGLKSHHISLSEQALKEVIEGYTREAGVRELDRKIATICRKVARLLVEDEKLKEVTVFPTTENTLEAFLGPAIFLPSKRLEKGEIGIVNGLAWTEAGGETLSVEAITLPGKGKLVLTGQMGDVMKESALTALGFVRSRYESLGLDKDFYNSREIHIHIPEGAIPKDGPSAGITMASAMISALTNFPVAQNTAMTGEITLRGKVLQVGGIKEKLLAAQRAGIQTVLLPENNKKDLKELPEKVVKSLTIRFVSSLEEVISYAFEQQDNLFIKTKEKVNQLFPKKRDTPSLPFN